MEQEMKELENRIQELKKQSHMLRKVLTEGGMGSAVFIERRNQLDQEMEAAWRRQRKMCIRDRDLIDKKTKDRVY